jgi:hypothetical protein
MLLVMGVRCRGHDRRSLGKPPGGDRLRVDGISRPRGLLRRRRLGTLGLVGGHRIAFRVVSPDVGCPEHTGAAAGIFGAPMIGIAKLPAKALIKNGAILKCSAEGWTDLHGASLGLER